MRTLNSFVPRPDALDRLSRIGYARGVEYTVIRSDRFSRWLQELPDRRTRAQITVRIDRAQRMARALEGELA